MDAVVGDRPAYLSRVDVHSALVSSALAAAVAGGAALAGWSSDRAGHPAGARRGASRCPVSSSPTAQRRAAQLAFLHGPPRAGIVEVHECARRRRCRARRPGRAAGAGRRRSRCAATSRLAVDRPGGGRAAAAPTPARTRSAATSSVDGAIGSRTAALHRALPRRSRRPRGGEIPDRTSRSPITCVACTLAGVQAGFHAIGDDAVRAVGRALREAAGAARARTATVRLAGLRAPGRARRDGRRRRRSPRSPRPARWRACSRCSTRPGAGRTGMYARRLGVGRAARDEPVRRRWRRRVWHWPSARTRR